MNSNINASISRLSASSMNDNQIATVNDLRTLISVKGVSHFINDFATNELNDPANELY